LPLFYCIRKHFLDDAYMEVDSIKNEELKMIEEDI
jgi:hypothetical protein